MGSERLRTVAELGKGVFGLTYIGGAAVHVLFWASNQGVYGEITQYILFDWYRNLWTGFVLPNLSVLLPMLAVIELLVGLGILMRGRVAKVGLALGGLFNLAVAPLGFWWPSNIGLVIAHIALVRYQYSATTVNRLRRWIRTGASA